MIPPARCSTLSTLATSLFDSKNKVYTLFTIPHICNTAKVKFSLRLNSTGTSRCTATPQLV